MAPGPFYAPAIEWPFRTRTEKALGKRLPAWFRTDQIPTFPAPYPSRHLKVAIGLGQTDMTILNSIGIFLASFLGLWLGAQLGIWLCRRSKTPSEGNDDANITLLGDGG